MKKGFISLIILCVCSILSAQHDKLDHFAIGYEEGLAFKYRSPDSTHGIKTCLMGGLSYHVNIPKKELKSESGKALHEFGIRLGGYRDIIIFPKVRTSFYFEVKQEMENKEITKIEDSLPQLKRIQIWDTSLRTGILVTFYCAEKFMISWKMGIDYSFYYGYNFNDYKELNIFGKKGQPFEALFNNLGFYIFF